MIVYGIRNCNTVKAALDWMMKHKIDFEFHDYKTKGITEEKLREWCRQEGWESLVNRKGTTWRQLDEKVKVAVTNQAAAIRLMMEKTSVIRRPLIEKDGSIVVLGFDAGEYDKTFGRWSTKTRSPG